MLDRNGSAEKNAVTGEAAIGRTIAALLLVPAAVILALYPLNLILGTVTFDTASIPLAPFRLLLIAPILLGLVLARRRKDWLLAAMLVPGIVLMLFCPDRIGSHQLNRGDSKAFYPEHYAGDQIATRIKDVERLIGDEDWFSRAVPPRLASIESIGSFHVSAHLSVLDWRDGELRKPKLQLELDRAKTNRAATAGPDMLIISRGTPTEDTRQKIAAIDAEITNLTAELNWLSSGDLYLAAVLRTAALKVKLETLERLVAEKVSFVNALPYIVAASISFALFIFAVGFLNWAMAGLVLMTALTCLWSAWPVSLDDWQIELPLILYPALICTLSAFLLRFVYRGYLDNVRLTNEFKARHLVCSAVLAIIFWLPFPLIVIAAVWANNYLYSHASSAIYCEGSASQFCGSLTSEPPIQDSDPARDTLRDDINATMQRLFARFEAETVRSSQAVGTDIAAQVNAAKAQVMMTFNRTLPPDIWHDNLFPELKPPKCSWPPDPICITKEMALERLNAAYQAPRNRLEASLKRTLDDVGNKVTTGVVKLADGFENAIKGESQAAALYSTKTVDATFVGLNMLGVSQMTLMLVVSMRALLLIFGRMLYLANPQPSKPKRDALDFPGLALTHCESKSPADARFTVKAYWDEFDLVGDKFLPLLTKRLHDVADADQATLLFGARYMTWPVRRFVNGCLMLKEVTRLPEKGSIRFSTTVGGRQLVVWTIPPGAEVFFRWDRFVAVTASMDIRKTFSLRIGGLVTGTTMHASVVGPGLLIQESRGQVGLIPGSVSPSRLMSWESAARFRIKSPKKLTSVYVDPSSLDIEPGKRVASDSSGGLFRGLGVLKDLMMLFRP
jgi:hypothetical protein